MDAELISGPTVKRKRREFPGRAIPALTIPGLSVRRLSIGWPSIHELLWGLAFPGLVLLGACSPAVEGPVLLVTSGFTDQILLVDPVDGTVVATRDMDVRPSERDEPHSVAVAPNGEHWYATLSHGEPTLWKYESRGDRLVGRVQLGLKGAGRIGISPDSRYAILPDYWLGGTGAVSQIVRIDLETLSVGEPREVCSAPHDAAWSPDGLRVALTCPLSDEVVLLDGATLDEIWRRQVETDGATAAGPGSEVTTGEGTTEGTTGEGASAGGGAPVAGNPRFQPMNLVWAPDGSSMFVTLMRSGEVLRLLANGEPYGRVRLGGNPTQLAVTPDGQQIVVALRADFSAALVDARSLSLIRRIAVPDIAHPHGVALSPDGRTAFISHEGTISSQGGVSAIDLASGEVLWSREAGVFNLGIAWRPAQNLTAAVSRD